MRSEHRGRARVGHATRGRDLPAHRAFPQAGDAEPLGAQRKAGVLGAQPEDVGYARAPVETDRGSRSDWPINLRPSNGSAEPDAQVIDDAIALQAWLSGMRCCTRIVTVAEVSVAVARGSTPQPPPRPWMAGRARHRRVEHDPRLVLIAVRWAKAHIHRGELPCGDQRGEGEKGEEENTLHAQHYVAGRASITEADEDECAALGEASIGGAPRLGDGDALTDEIVVDLARRGRRIPASTPLEPRPAARGPRYSKLRAPAGCRCWGRDSADSIARGLFGEFTGRILGDNRPQQPHGGSLVLRIGKSAVHVRQQLSGPP